MRGIKFIRYFLLIFVGYIAAGYVIDAFEGGLQNVSRVFSSRHIIQALLFSALMTLTFWFRPKEGK